MVQDKEIEEVNPSEKFGYGIRHVQMLCMCMCMIALFLGRSILGVAVLAMTDVSRRNDTNVEIYDWDKKTQGIILSSFFWGYMMMQIPAGLLARRYGGKPILLVSLLANGVLCLALPTLVHYGGWISVCICRMCMGLTQACLFSASHTMFGRWLPSSERTALSAFVYGGHSLGTIIAMPLSGLLAETALGWKMIFYCTAGLMLVTALIWYWFAASSPAEHRMISDEERYYIETELNTGHLSDPKRPTPWGAMFRTVPLWAIMATHVGTTIAFTLFFVDLPTYLDKAMQISLKNSAILSALPYLGMWAGSVISGSICEKFFNRGLLSLVACRKIFNSIAQFGTAAGYIILAFLHPEQKEFAVVVVIATLTFLGFIYSGFMINHLDLSPQFAGVMLSITNFAGAIGSLLTPVITSVILQNDPTNISNWRVVFLLIAGFVVMANIIYIIFGSADRQPWDSQETYAPVATIDEMNPLKNSKNMKENTMNDTFFKLVTTEPKLD